MKASRLRTASAIFVTLAATAAAVPAISGTSVAATPASAARQQVDFNGDGYEDMYASVPDGTVSGLKKAGYLVVYPGDAKGVSAARHQVINQNTSGVPGSAAANARFGAGTPADIDRDGYTDLLVSAGNGPQIILFGGKGGLGTRAVEFRGKGYALGDFDGDGRTDAAGIDNATWTGKVVLDENIGADGSVGSTRTALTADNGVTVFEGVQAVDMNNDGKDDLLVSSGCDDEPDCGGRSLYLSTGTGFTYTPIVTAPGTYLEHSTVTAGSVNGDAYPDLVFTRQPTGMDSDVDFPSKGGAVAVVLGGPKGQNTAVKPKWITQATAGVPGADERGDDLGASAAVGDLDGDGYGEVVVGLPGEDVGTAKDSRRRPGLQGPRLGHHGRRHEGDRPVHGERPRSRRERRRVRRRGPRGGPGQGCTGHAGPGRPGREHRPGRRLAPQGQPHGPGRQGQRLLRRVEPGREAVGGPLRLVVGVRGSCPSLRRTKGADPSTNKAKTTTR